MAKTGEASILAVADVSKFAAQLQKDLNTAIAGIKLNADNLGRQISDGVRGGVDQANTEMRRLGDQSAQLTNIITNNSSRAATNMAASFRRAGAEMSNVGEQMSMFVSLPLAAAGGLTVRAAGNFEQMMYRVQAATEATGPVFDQLRRQAIDLGATTSYSATEAASGMQILATAGFNAAQIMDALPNVLNMAAAGAVDLATAADISSNILNGFGFQAKDLGRVNDVLARTFMSTATNLTDLGNSFKYVGPIAKSAGLSFEEVSAAIGLMGNAGIKGEMAGTALRGAMARLMSPTKEVQSTLTKLGVTVTDSAGRLLPLVDTMRRLETSGATTADMMKIFGQEAGPGMMALLSQGSTALAGLTTQLQNSGGTADKVAKTQLQGLNASLEGLSGAVESLMIAIGYAGLLDALTRAAKKATELVGALAKLSPTLLNIVAVMGAVLAATGPVLLVVGKITEAIGFLMPYIKKFGGAFKSFGSAAMAFFVTPAGWVVLAIAALVAALVVAYKYSASFRTIMQRTFKAVGDAGKRLWTTMLRPAFAALVVGFRALGREMQRLWTAAVPVFVALGRIIAGAWNGQIWPMLQSWGKGFTSAGGRISAFWTSSVSPAISAIIRWFQLLGSAVGAWWSQHGAGVFATARGVMAQVGGMISTIWSGVIAVFRAVGAVVGWAFTNIIVPAVKAVVGIIKLLINVVVALKPVWIVLGAIVVAAIVVIVAAVKVLWAAFVWTFNAVAAIVRWLWGSVITPVFALIGAVIKAVAVVIQWLWTSVVSPIVMFIASAVAVLGTVLIWLKGAVVTAWNAIGAAIGFVWSSIIMPVVNFLVAAFRMVAGVVATLWGVFGPIWMAIGNLVMTVWSGVFSVVFDLLKLGFTAVWGVIQLWWAGVRSIFSMLSAVVSSIASTFMVGLSAIGAAFSWLWSAVISPFISAAIAGFTKFWAFVQPVLSAFGAMFTWLWSSAISPTFTAISAALTWLWSNIVMIFNAVVAFVRAAISQIVAAAGGIAAFVNSIAGYFQAAVNAIRDKLGAAISFVRGLPGQIISAVGNLGSLLYEAGQNVISGLINGLSSRIGALRAKIHEAASAIRDALPFSPAREGPLSGSGDPTISGGKIITRLTTGLEMQTPEVRRTMDTLGSMISQGLLAGRIGADGAALMVSPLATPPMVTAPVGTAVPGGAGVTNTYSITVNTLDPRSAATAVVDAVKAYEQRNGKGWRA